MGANKEYLGYIALAIHPIVGAQRWRFGQVKNASASITVKSIMTAKAEAAKAEVGKVEIKTTDG